MKHSRTMLLLYIVLLHSCQAVNVVQHPIPFSDERIQLSLHYLKERHGLNQTTPEITPKIVVVHWTAIPTLEGSYQAFIGSRLPGSRSGISGASNLNVSAHYLVDQDGSILQLMPDTLFARHTIGLNHCAIGIENVGDGNKYPLTQRQFKSNVRLIKKLLKEHHIEFVIGHHEYRLFEKHLLWKEPDPNFRTKKSDPGDLFMRNLRRKLGLPIELAIE